MRLLIFTILCLFLFSCDGGYHPDRKLPKKPEVSVFGESNFGSTVFN